MMTLRMLRPFLLGLLFCLAQVQAQSPKGTSGFAINFGLTGSWYNPQTPGQGFVIDVVVGQEPQQLVVYWFTFDTEVGGPEGQRWYVAQGEFEDGADTVVLDLFLPTGGVFDRDDPVSLETIGEAEVEFAGCTEAVLNYDIHLDGNQDQNATGAIPLERLSPEVLCTTLKQQPEPPCEKTYGNVSNIFDIQDAMFERSLQSTVEAINQAKNVRGTMAGCPQVDYGPREEVNTVEPTLSEIEQIWNSLYRNEISKWDLSCPPIGREHPTIGLAAYYAHHAGYFDDLALLETIAEKLLGTQYRTEHALEPLVAPPGVFGYRHPEQSNSCSLSGRPGDLVQELCTDAPDLCVTYQRGIWAGHRFAVNDHKQIGPNPVNFVGDLGGAGYDHGWSGVFMLESARQLPDPLKRQSYMESAELAGEWAIQHPSVYNHNYTAKLVWLLAALYKETGRQDFREALIDKLDMNLVPGILMDLDEDGLVDGMNPPVKFTELTPVAQIPGRMWDGHNAVLWYHSINAWAMVEAYVAFRDRGDQALAQAYRPYTIAMLDNLATEIVELGPPSPASTGWRDSPFSLLLGIWKIAHYENDPHPLWDQAAAAIWNAGALEIQGTRGVNVALYLLIRTSTPYIP